MLHYNIYYINCNGYVVDTTSDSIKEKYSSKIIKVNIHVKDMQAAK
jgi:hypothetical protein